MFKTLRKKIMNRKAKVGVIGLGYVGLPLAITFAKKRFDVIGIDINEKRIKEINRGISYISDVSNYELKKVLRKKSFEVTTDFKAIKRINVVIICVPTPLGKKRVPDISYIRKAVTNVKDNIRNMR